MCVGIPFSNLGCPKVNAKMHFNDWRRKKRGGESEGGAPNGRPRGDNASNGGGSGGSALTSADGGGGGVNGIATGEVGQRLLSGREWYTQDAFRALNQVASPPATRNINHKAGCYACALFGAWSWPCYKSHHLYV